MSLPAEHSRRRDEIMAAQRNDGIGSSRCRVQPSRSVPRRNSTVQRQHHQHRQETGPKARKSHAEQWRTGRSVSVHWSIRAHGKSKVAVHVLRHTVRNCTAVIVLLILFPIWLSGHVTYLSAHEDDATSRRRQNPSQ